MVRNTVTRTELSEAVHRAIGLSYDESRALVASVFDQISECLSEGESVKISGFATFSVRDKALRMGRNPMTGESVPISPRRVVVFRASDVLKDRLKTRAPIVPSEREILAAIRAELGLL